MTTDLDRRLAAFLDESESDRALGVTGQSLKASLDRIADQQLQHDGEDKERHKEVMGLIKGHEFRIGNLERRERPPTHGGQRDPDASYHDFDAELQQARAILRDRIRDAKDPLDETKAKAIAAEVVHSALNNEKAGKWDDVQKRSTSRRDQIIASVIGGILLILAAAAAGHIEGRASAPLPTVQAH